ncbi:hypothetical protein ASD21_00465 [Caulobacter sp. Root1455]|uniref:hypothetical protein n=1 Tax=unclassified Caulobacter TaxID=2648921 RepID=UPI0006F2AA13|nr:MULTISPECIES: hypothetical protein [unclassified Caulobacter]KQY35873.1 hypothetical protein ASD38_04840 [Caulobacter sp. Root487D2Y]KQZ06151.1 hypothetical protein ASD21_00465 [Caulobacter sp. Root1455]
MRGRTYLAVGLFIGALIVIALNAGVIIPFVERRPEIIAVSDEPFAYGPSLASWLGEDIIHNVALMLKEMHPVTDSGLRMETLNPAPTLLFDRPGFTFEASDGHVQAYRGVFGDSPIDPHTDLRPVDPVGMLGRVAGTLDDVNMRPFMSAAGVHIPDVSLPPNERDWVTRVVHPGASAGSTNPPLPAVRAAVEGLFEPAFSAVVVGTSV